MNSNTQDKRFSDNNHANPNINEPARQTQTPPNSKNHQLKLSSCHTGVNPYHTHGLGIWGNPRVVMGIRVDKKLKKRFTEVAKLKFGSTCNPIESFMAGVVGTYLHDLESGVNPCNTVSIGEIRIERNLRERRKMVDDTQVDTTINTEREKVEFSGCVVCGKVAYVLAFEEKEQNPLCKKHFEGKKKDFVLHGVGWRVLD